MSKARLILEVPGYPDLLCRLHEQAPELNAQEIVKVRQSVFADGEYRFVISVDQNDSIDWLNTDIKLFINGQKVDVETCLDGSKLTLIPRADTSDFYHTKVQPFKDLFGVVQLMVLVDCIDQKISWFTDFLQVLLKDTSEAKQLKSMADYVIRHYENLLTKNGKDLGKPSSQFEFNTSKNNELLSVCDFLEEILSAYDRYLSYFTSHCRVKLIQVQRKDNFEKLKNFEGNTINYILQHPEELYSVTFDTGIKNGYQNYLPRQTLVGNSTTSRSTYENRVLVGFLHYLSGFVEKLLIRIDRDIQASIHPVEVLGYVSSVDAILSSAIDRFIRVKDKLLLSQEHLSRLYASYKRIFPISEQALTAMPAPTQTFILVPVYRLFYELMARWFAKPVYDFYKEDMLFSFLVNSRLYEYYVLVTELENLRGEGLTLSSSYRFLYHGISKMKYYEKPEYANTFVFRREDVTVTLYYQPVIYGANLPDVNGISLKRITRLCWGDREKGADYYTPDYLYKIETDKGVSYIIADAKYSTLDSVKRHYASELAFKYLLSIRPIEENATLDGLQVFYGKPFKATNMPVSFWDLLNKSQRGDFGPSFIAEARYPLGMS